jgi:hypothetical protein
MKIMSPTENYITALKFVQFFSQCAGGRLYTFNMDIETKHGDSF